MADRKAGTCLRLPWPRALRKSRACIQAFQVYSTYRQSAGEARDGVLDDRQTDQVEAAAWNIYFFLSDRGVSKITERCGFPGTGHRHPRLEIR